MRAGKDKGPGDCSPGPSAWCMMVRLAGIEPTTPWFVAKYSIQLSYSREAGIIAAVALIAKGAKKKGLEIAL